MNILKEIDSIFTEDKINFWKNMGYTKPTAKSMIILYDVIEYTEGCPKPGGLLPWCVKLTDDAVKILNLDCSFICNVSELHRIAKKYLQKGD